VTSESSNTGSPGSFDHFCYSRRLSRTWGLALACSATVSLVAAPLLLGGVRGLAAAALNTAVSAAFLGSLLLIGRVFVVTRQVRQDVLPLLIRDREFQ
jgi:hypothetical protein